MLVHIKNEVGSWIEDIDLIKNKFLFDFSHCLKSSHSHGTVFSPFNAINKVTFDENFDLINPILEDEIHTIVFQMHPSKAPGPDGFGLVFFKNIDRN